MTYPKLSIKMGNAIATLGRWAVELRKMDLVTNETLDTRGLIPFPTGCWIGYCGGAAPDGWLLCNGDTVSRTSYGALFSAIQTSYGVGDGSTTFTLPDWRQRVPMGVAASGTGSTLGGTGGTIDASMRAHYHAPGTLTVSISHDHANASTTSVGDHSHEQFVTANSGGSGNRRDYVADGTGLQQYSQGINTGGAGTHYHDLNMPSFSGNSPTITAGNVGATGGIDGDTVRTAAAANMPFQTCNFIIKT